MPRLFDMSPQVLKGDLPASCGRHQYNSGMPTYNAKQVQSTSASELNYSLLQVFQVSSYSIFTFGGMSSSCRNQELRSNFSTRGGRGGFSEVGSEFCLGISGRWEVTVRASWNPAIPFVGCSCSDWEAGKEGPWDFTLTRCGIYAPS